VGREVLVNLQRDESAVIMTISDFGHGITPNNMHHLFEPFYTTKTSSSSEPNTRRGLGIGLGMVKQFVEEDFKGSITVTSRATEGTVFVVRFSTTSGQEKKE
jgi:signal transduction histidine kinase